MRLGHVLLIESLMMVSMVRWALMAQSGEWLPEPVSAASPV
jgi:hypothetical protein